MLSHMQALEDALREFVLCVQCYYCGSNVCTPTQSSYVEILILPTVIVLGGEAFGRSLGHEGGAVGDGTGVLIRTERACCSGSLLSTF